MATSSGQFPRSSQFRLSTRMDLVRQLGCFSIQNEGNDIMKRISLLALVGGLASVTHGANASPGFRGGHSCVDAGPTVPYGLYRTASALGFVLLHFETDGAKLVTCPVTVEQSS